MENDVRKRRKERGESQAEMADGVHLSRRTVNAIEDERYNPSLEVAFRLATHFECSVEELFEPPLEEP